ncbi:uncharacterized protein LOC116536040 isoform X1 [Sapajus apella]|uniref:Uncharacterized protein LOC116536040 isoform X1 n=1 Tax=Sapajus apella TaxID=9515 RepID=A0A6J3G6D4_SAPAP|nr:uncharacterized protein LOC116536040 isoform X1 [Sapajus apella]
MVGQGQQQLQRKPIFQISGTWYIKAIAAKKGILGKNVSPVILSLLSSGNIQASFTKRSNGQCHKIDMILEKTRVPGRYRTCEFRVGGVVGVPPERKPLLPLCLPLSFPPCPGGGPVPRRGSCRTWVSTCGDPSAQGTRQLVYLGQVRHLAGKAGETGTAGLGDSPALPLWPSTAGALHFLHMEGSSVRDHRLFFSELQFEGERFQVAKLMGRNPGVNTKALEEFKKFAQRKGFLKDDIFIPLQTESCSPEPH